MVWYSLMPCSHQIQSIDCWIFTDANIRSDPINWWFGINLCLFPIKSNQLMVCYSLIATSHQIQPIDGLIFTDANIPSNPINWLFGIHWSVCNYLPIWAIFSRCPFGQFLNIPIGQYCPDGQFLGANFFSNFDHFQENQIAHGAANLRNKRSPQLDSP